MSTTIGSVSCFRSNPFISMHIKAYRALSRSIDGVVDSVASVVLGAMNYFSGRSAPTIGSLLRTVTPIDYCYMTTLRSVNAVVTLTLQRPLWDKEDLKTLSQLRKEAEKARFIGLLGQNSIYPTFCDHSSRLITEIIPKFAGEIFGRLPKAIETYLLYNAPLYLRYLNHKIDQKTGYRQFFLDSEIGKHLDHLYCGISSSLANSLLSHDNINPLINFEHILLMLCAKIPSGNQTGSEGFPLFRLIIKSLGESIKNMEEVDQFVKSCACRSDEEAFIARLEWYKQRNILPKGLPDPHRVSLNSCNLEQELDLSLTRYLNEVSNLILNRLCPRKFSNPILNAFYHLEGKDILKMVLTLLINEFAVKQVADPHLFTLAILFARGVEVTDYELDGFGRKSTGTIHRAGMEMMNESLKDNTTWRAIVSIFEQTKLKSNPGSFEGLAQKKEAKDLLRKMIADTVYQALKDETYSHSGLGNTIRKKLSELPILGLATTTLHIICNGMWYSLNYLVRDEKHQQATFGEWMVRHLSGRKGAEYIADKVVELIFHPGWRFIVLRFIETISDHLQNRVTGLHSETPESESDNLRTIVYFLLKHFTKDAGIPIEGILDYIAGPEKLEGLQSHLRTPGKPLVEVALESLLPTIKESLLFTKITNLFRRHSIQFEGDDVFWKLFVREHLNRLVHSQARCLYSDINAAPLSELTAIRVKILDELLEKDQRSLRQFFSQCRFKPLKEPASGVTKEIEEFELIEDYLTPPRTPGPASSSGDVVSPTPVRVQLNVIPSTPPPPPRLFRPAETSRETLPLPPSSSFDPPRERSVSPDEFVLVDLTLPHYR